jgi:hypothetical protein
MIVPMVVFLIGCRAGFVRLGVPLIAFAIPWVVTWSGCTKSTVYAFRPGAEAPLRTRRPSRNATVLDLWGRASAFCATAPVEARPGEWYLWADPKAPARTLPDAVVLGFAQKTNAHQPLDYAKAVAGGTAHAFYPGQRQRRREPCIGNVGFPDSTQAACSTPGLGNAGRLSHPVAINGSLANGLRWYARVDYLIGPVFLACVVLTLLALLWRPGARGWRPRLDAGLYASVGLTIMVSAIATSNFNYRYTAVLYYTLPIAAAIALTP